MSIALNLLQITVYRMSGKIQSECFPLPFKDNFVLPFRNIGLRALYLLRCLCQYPEHIRLTDGFRFGVLIRCFQRILQ